MHNVILVANSENEELKVLMEESLGGRASVIAYHHLPEVFPDILKVEPLLALIDAKAVSEEELGVIGTLKSTYPFMRVIFIFAKNQRDLAARAVKYGADAYILEPYYLDELSQMLRSKFLSAVQQIRQSLDSRMDTLSSFVEGLAPEINNPLTTIRGFLQILLSQAPQKIDHKEMSEIYNLMEKESQRIGQIVLEMENFSRIRRPKRLPVDFTALVEKIVADTLRETDSSIKVTKDFQDIPEACMLDSDLISSAMNSILKFLLMGTNPKKGEIELSISGSNHEGSLDIVFTGHYTRSISEDLHRVFIPLYSRKIVKFGEELGLSSAYGIIRSHGGRIRVLPEQNGCRFLIELPVA